MRTLVVFGLIIGLTGLANAGDDDVGVKLSDGWRAELAAQAPSIVFPTAVVQAPDGTVYLGQDPMDMPGPATAPIDSIVAWRNGKVQAFADKLWAVMGLEWADGVLYVVHAPYLSALRDTDGDGRADRREDLITGLGPPVPAFNGINDHIASGIRLGMDGFLYIAVGDKGLHRAVGKDGATIQLFGGGVLRVRPDGTGLEVVSTGERNPLSVALTATDEIFTYGNDDDSHQWPNSFTHHIVGGHFGYPYEFRLAPSRALPIVGGEIGGAGAQGVCYNEDGLPDAYRGNFFFCDWGLQTVFRIEVERVGGTFRIKSRRPFVTRGTVSDFRPFSLAVAADGKGFWLVDWAFNGWLVDGPKTGRLFRLTYTGPTARGSTAPAHGENPRDRLDALEHRALAVRLEAQRCLAAMGPAAVNPLVERLAGDRPATSRTHALWALDAIGTPDARASIREAIADRDAAVRAQAARSAGIRHDRAALSRLATLLRDRDPVVRREAAIAIGKLGDAAGVAPLMNALGDPDVFAAWSIRRAIRTLDAWDKGGLVAALVDERRRDDALKLTDEAWAVAVVEALNEVLPRLDLPHARARVVENLAGLYRRYPAWTGHWFGTNPLAGPLRRKTEDWDPRAMGLVLDGLNAGLEDRDSAVRYQAIAGLRLAGPVAARRLMAALSEETDDKNLVLAAQALGEFHATDAIEPLTRLVHDGGRAQAVRAAALDALGSIPDPKALSARLALVYDRKAPAELLARALPALAQSGSLPMNDLAMFLDHSAPDVRAAALSSLRPRKLPATLARRLANGGGTAVAKVDPRLLRAMTATPDPVKRAVMASLDDRAVAVRRAALHAVVTLRIREAVPRLLELTEDQAMRADAVLALAALPDARAVSVYLSALSDRSLELRRTGEAALAAIRDEVAPSLERTLRSEELDGSATQAVERILARFRPIVAWRVIGPFPRTTGPGFLGQTSIDFSRTYPGAGGQAVAWAERAADPKTGRVLLDVLKPDVADRGRLGYAAESAADLGAFAFAEVQSHADRPAMLRLGSSGSLLVVLNDTSLVYRFQDSAGRPYAPDTDIVPINLRKGTNRLLILAREGIGEWSFSVQVSEPAESLARGKPAPVSREALRAFAERRSGDARRGEELFFDPKGVGCVKCHAVSGRGNAAAGPDLAGLALKYDKQEIIRSVLEPSQRIASGYQAAVVACTDGSVVTGLIRSETDAELELTAPDGTRQVIVKSNVVARRPSDASLMPVGLTDSLTVVEFADLISFLESLRGTSPVAK
jgi:putative heme-binding domain-containing protein